MCKLTPVVALPFTSRRLGARRPPPPPPPPPALVTERPPPPPLSPSSVDRRRPGRSLHCNTTSTVVLLGSHPNTMHTAQNKRLPQHSSIPDIRLHTRFNDRRSPALPSRNFSLCNFRTITNSNPKLANVHQKSRSQSTWITNQSLPISFKSSTQWKK